MLMRFFGRKKELQVTDYLLGEKNGDGSLRVASPLLIAGDKDFYDAWLSCCSYNARYTSGVLTWFEDYCDINAVDVNKTVRDGLAILTDGVPLEQFPHFLVMHHRPKGFDVHFVLGRTHLVRGRSFPFFRNNFTDRNLTSAWRRKVNLLHGWSDPEDPWRQRYSSPPPSYLNSDARDLYNEIRDLSDKEVGCGFAGSRSDVIKQIESRGYAVNPKRYCLQVDGRGHRLKLRGFIFCEGTDYSELWFGDIVRPVGYKPGFVDSEIIRLDGVIKINAARRTRDFTRFHETRSFLLPPRIDANSRSILTDKNLKNEALGLTIKNETNDTVGNIASVLQECGHAYAGINGNLAKMLGIITEQQADFGSAGEADFRSRKAPGFDANPKSDSKSVERSEAISPWDSQPCQFLEDIVEKTGQLVAELADQNIPNLAKPQNRPRLLPLPIPFGQNPPKFTEHEIT